jgi:ubiquinone/menaquinone biosynthesis C-methylase UbiE
VVADIGAGEGRLTLAAAQRVGSSGHVFTTELDPRLLVNLEGLAARQKVQNITVIKAGEAQTNLPRECCDSIFMRHVYHHFRQPAQEDASLFQSLKPGGILAVIDFQPSQDASTLESGNEDVPSNRGGHGVTKQALIEELSAAGFQVVTTPTDWPGEDYCVVFRKPPQ